MKFEKLGLFVDIQKGKKPNISENPSADSVRVIQIDDLRNDENLKFTNEKTGVLAKKDDALIAWDGANAGTIGYGKEGYIGSTIALLRVKNPEKFYTPFLGKFLQSKSQILRSKSTGATIPHIDGKMLRSLLVPILDKKDQIFIADLLAKAEALIAQRKESLELLDRFVKSTFKEMFGDPTRNEMGWDYEKLGNQIKVKHGFAFSSNFFSSNGKYVLLTPGNFFEKGGYRDRGEKQKYFVGPFSTDYLLSKGSLLVAMTEQAEGLLGSVIIVPDEGKFLHNQRLGLLKFSEGRFSPWYLFYVFNSKNFRSIISKNATGTKVRHTSPDRIEGVHISIPPLSLQAKFAEVVEKVEALKTQYTESLRELEKLYGSLCQQAFKGELTFEPKDGKFDARLLTATMSDEPYTGTLMGDPDAVEPSTKKSDGPLASTPSNPVFDAQGANSGQNIPNVETTERAEEEDQFLKPSSEIPWQSFFTTNFFKKSISAEEAKQLLLNLGYDFEYDHFSQALFDGLQDPKPYLRLNYADRDKKQIEVNLIDAPAEIPA